MILCSGKSNNVVPNLYKRRNTADPGNLLPYIRKAVFHTLRIGFYWFCRTKKSEQAYHHLSYFSHHIEQYIHILVGVFDLA